MQYVMSVERLGEERGMQAGIHQGFLQGEQNLLLRLLTKRFGTLPEQYQQQVSQANTEQLEYWIDQVLTATNLDDIVTPNPTNNY